MDAQEVPLRRELEYLQLYFSIEEVRFQDRMRVKIAVETVTYQTALFLLRENVGLRLLPA